MSISIERAVIGDDTEYLADMRALFQRRKQVKEGLLEREKELRSQLATEQRSNPAVAIATRVRLEKIQKEINRLKGENNRGQSPAKIRRNTNLAALTLIHDLLKSTKQR